MCGVCCLLFADCCVMCVVKSVLSVARVFFVCLFACGCVLLVVCMLRVVR